MHYLCKIFTPAFKRNVDRYVDRCVKEKLMEENVDSERKSYLSSFTRMQVMDSLFNYWNNKSSFSDDFHGYMESIGIGTPEYQEMVFKAHEQGLQSRARILWEGKVRKIDEIDEIFSYSVTVTYPLPVLIVHNTMI